MGLEKIFSQIVCNFQVFFCVPKIWRCHLPTESVQQLLAAVGVVLFPEKVSLQLIWISNSITVRPPTFHSTSRIQMVCSRPSSWKFKINVKPVVKMVAARGQHQQSTASPPPPLTERCLEQKRSSQTEWNWLNYFVGAFFHIRCSNICQVQFAAGKCLFIYGLFFLSC